MEPDTQTSAARVASSRRRVVLAATSMGLAVVQLDVSVVNVAIKPIGASLGGGVAALQWVVDAYTLAFAALILTAGSLGDRFGARRVFVAGFAVFTLASAACALAPDVTALIAARALQGVGAAALASCSLSLLTHAYREPAARVRAVALWAAGASTALAAGPVAGGALIATLGWPSIFFINLPIGVAGISLTLRYATDPPRRDGRAAVDPWGQVTAGVALTALAGAAIEAGARGLTDPLVLGGFAVALVSGALFVIAERRTPHPMLPLRLFAVSRFALPVAIGLLVNVAFYGLIFVFSLFFQQEQRLSPLETGLMFTPMLGAIVAANITAARLARRVAPRALIVTGALLLAAACLGMLPITASTGPAVLAAAFALEGFGLGLVVPVMTATLMSSVDHTRSGVAAGTLNASRQTGSLLGVAAFGSLAAETALVDGLRAALLISAVLAIGAAALGLVLGGVRDHERSPLSRS
ncbi:MFS transporter [Nonomuraea sp. NPDC050536]|uniref:MFS transporter n=1 Tax=Nonomuraea sp. NPDC050536 TaxID=3364366 RepID=UPI0037CB0CA1